VVETNIHFPTDATLLWDTVRTVTRLVEALHEILPRGVPGFTNRRRSARRRMPALERMTAQERHTQQEPKYRELLRITEQVLASARQVIQKAARVKGIDVAAQAMAEQLRQQITEYCEWGDRVIDQTRRRVIDGEQVPAEEKVYSIFESHTDLIKRGQARKPVEFGHKVFLAESAQGLITDYQVLDGNPADTSHVQASLERHQQIFHCASDLYAGDRGFYSAENWDECQKVGVSQVSIPQRGGHKTAEREALESSPAFKKGQRFRAGIEGRISVLFRGRGMKRCRAQGRERFAVLVGAAVLWPTTCCGLPKGCGTAIRLAPKKQHDLPSAAPILGQSTGEVRPHQPPVLWPRGPRLSSMLRTSHISLSIRFIVIDETNRGKVCPPPLG
jgi:IS5 family transposase